MFQKKYAYNKSKRQTVSPQGDEAQRIRPTSLAFTMRGPSTNLFFLATAFQIGAGYVHVSNVSPIDRRGVSCTMLKVHRHHQDSVDRRGAISRALGSGTAALFTSGLAYPVRPALAREKEAITPENVKEAFGNVRKQLEDPSGGIADLENRIMAKDWEGVMDFTKNYDGPFRKATVGRARKLLTDKKVKADSQQTSNAITFDLIGINRASRPGQENQDEALKYLGELKADVQKILDLESTVDFSAVE